jgi:predicted helicase
MKNGSEVFVDCLYRPFDWRTCYFGEVAMDYPRREIKQHVLGKNNICILTSRQQADAGFQHVLLTEDPAESCVVSNKTKEQNYVFPLYLYPNAETVAAPELLTQASDWPSDESSAGRTPNLKKEFVTAIAEATGFPFTPSGEETQAGMFNPPDVLHYIYGILHSSSYRETYSQFLMLDFPRIPIPKSAGEFVNVTQLGKQLRSLHLLDNSVALPKEVHFPIAGDNTVARAHPKFIVQEGALGRVYINTNQYFEGIAEEAWSLEMGSYQVLEKWLKDRQGRQLSYEDLTQYQKIIGAINGTLSVMATLDEVIEF